MSRIVVVPVVRSRAYRYHAGGSDPRHARPREATPWSAPGDGGISSASPRRVSHEMQRASARFPSSPRTPKCYDLRVGRRRAFQRTEARAVTRRRRSPVAGTAAAERSAAERTIMPWQRSRLAPSPAPGAEHAVLGWAPPPRSGDRPPMLRTKTPRFRGPPDLRVCPAPLAISRGLCCCDAARRRMCDARRSVTAADPAAFGPPPQPRSLAILLHASPIGDGSAAVRVLVSM